MTTERWRKVRAAVAYGLTVTFATMALVVAVISVIPAAAPALWFGVPISLCTGVAAIHNKAPDDTYPIAALSIPIIGFILVLIALQVSWTVVGDYL
jgi:hypothetical protein